MLDSDDRGLVSGETNTPPGEQSSPAGKSKLRDKAPSDGFIRLVGHRVREVQPGVVQVEAQITCRGRTFNGAASGTGRSARSTQSARARHPESPRRLPTNLLSGPVRTGPRSRQRGRSIRRRFSRGGGDGNRIREGEYDAPGRRVSPRRYVGPVDHTRDTASHDPHREPLADLGRSIPRCGGAGKATMTPTDNQDPEGGLVQRVEVLLSS